MREFIVVLTVLLFVSCDSIINEKEVVKEPNLLANREAPLGWVYLKTYPDSSFEFVLTGIRERSVYSGKYRVDTDTIFFDYSDSIPELNSTQAIFKNNSIVYLNGTYNEVLRISINKLFADSLGKKIEPNSVNSSCQEELNKALDNSTIDSYYKDIYQTEKLIFTTDNKMLSITDSLFTNTPETELFYFIVFTKSMNGSDGFYSESIGVSSFNFITQRTEQFAEFFYITPKLNEKDLDNWAEYIYNEIQISSENQEQLTIEQLESELTEKLKESRKEHKVVIEMLIKKIKKINELSH